MSLFLNPYLNILPDKFFLFPYKCTKNLHRNYLSLAPKVAPLEILCPNGAFPAPEVVAGAIRCQKECFPAPKATSREFRCPNEAFPAPDLVAGAIRCQKECFPAPKVASRVFRCPNGAFPAPEICREEGAR